MSCGGGGDVGVFINAVNDDSKGVRVDGVGGGDTWMALLVGEGRSRSMPVGEPSAVLVDDANCKISENLFLLAVFGADGCGSIQNCKCAVKI